MNVSRNVLVDNWTKFLFDESNNWLVIYKNNNLNYFWEDQIKKNQQLDMEYKSLKKNNISDIYIIDEPYAIGDDDEGTVDGVHFNDLGFQRYAHYLTRNLKSLELI